MTKSVSWNESVRKQLLEKTGGHCSYCGKILTDAVPWNVEHVTPIAQGGTNSYENLVPSCYRCNSMKRKKTPEEFREWLRQRVTGPLSCAGQALSDDTFLTDIDRNELLRLLIKVDRALSDSRTVFYLDGKHPGFEDSDARADLEDL